MDAKVVRDYFENPRVVRDYAAAAENVGLWASEKTVIEKFVPKSAAVLELGCGAGRIARGLGALGYENIVATDFSSAMVESARALAQKYGDKTVCKVCDATHICFAPRSFDAVIFGFNGLMQIPKSKNRQKALAEIFRVLKPDGVFIFTTHERDVGRNQAYWESERRRWAHNCQDPVLDDFGDVFYGGDHGNVYIHSPSDAEISDMLNKVGFSVVFKSFRSEICRETPAVEDFSDDCVFRVVKKLRT